MITTPEFERRTAVGRLVLSRKERLVAIDAARTTFASQWCGA